MHIRLRVASDRQQAERPLAGPTYGRGTPGGGAERPAPAPPACPASALRAYAARGQRCYVTKISVNIVRARGPRRGRRVGAGGGAGRGAGPRPVREYVV
ncbi:hypothetical protein EVAR_85016_1 [Eumeta japonica]|uniref:Uncharacterized protein n=1 Tax=Eumeta variegata TaxID=151549 RepID=A0A4C1WB99_EUMVA|nr:hypothetical protein EVAR_85016_1 [Eumeta japonica]